MSPSDVALDVKDTEATVTLRKEDFQGPNGIVRYVALILADKNVTGGEIQAYENNTWPNITNTQEGVYYQQLSEDRWNPFNRK